MKLSYYQLEAHLNKTLASFYLLSSDEPLLIQEAIELICATANKAGFIEQETVTSETLYTAAHSPSLFSTRRILKLFLSDTKAHKVLESYAENPVEDILLIACLPKVDARTEKTRWYQIIEKNAVTMPIWPVTLEQLPTWINQRAKKLGLTIALDAAKFLADQVEGNLLAAAQEIEKLSLLFLSSENKTIDRNQLEKATTDNARFDIFHLVESFLLGNNARSLRILANLQAEDIEPILIVWALTREIRTLADMQKQLKQGASLSSLFSKFRIWEKRQSGVRRFLQNHTEKSCWDLLSQAAYLDRIMKGGAAGNIWDELQRFVLLMKYSS